MSTTGAVPAGNLTTEKVTVRTYVTFNSDGTIKERRTQAQTKDGANWKKLEAERVKDPSGAVDEKGSPVLVPVWTLFNENEVVRYAVKDLAAAQVLIPDETQLAYVIQAGINYIQNSKTSTLCGEIKEGTDTKEVPAEPAYNGEELDMREHINAPPSRTSLSPMEKLEKLLAGFPPEVRAQLLAQAVATMQAAPQQEEVQQEEQPA